MVVDNFGLVRISVSPREANPPLIVHADRMLALPATFQPFQPIGGRHRKAFSRRAVLLKGCPSSPRWIVIKPIV